MKGRALTIAARIDGLGGGLGKVLSILASFHSTTLPHARRFRLHFSTTTLHWMLSTANRALATALAAPRNTGAEAGRLQSR